MSKHCKAVNRWIKFLSFSFKRSCFKVFPLNGSKLQMRARTWKCKLVNYWRKFDTRSSVFRAENKWWYLTFTVENFGIKTVGVIVFFHKHSIHFCTTFFISFRVLCIQMEVGKRRRTPHRSPIHDIHLKQRKEKWTHVLYCSITSK